MKKIFILLLFLATVSLFTKPIFAIRIGYFPGLTKLIDSADAIVILRIDKNLTDFDNPTLYSTHECFIYQTLKGKITKDTRMNLQLMDTQTDFATPYAHGSVHLMFLMKKQTKDEPTEYRTMTFEGAHFRLPPLGNEKMPDGNTIEEKIKNLLNKAISYETEEHEKKQTFLKSLLINNDSNELNIISKERNLNRNLIGIWVKEKTFRVENNNTDVNDWDLTVTFNNNGRFLWDSKRRKNDGKIIDESLTGTYSIERGFLINYKFDKPSKQALERIPELFAFWPNKLLGQQTLSFKDDYLVLGFEADKIWFNMKRKM